MEKTKNILKSSQGSVIMQSMFMVGLMAAVSTAVISNTLNSSEAQNAGDRRSEALRLGQFVASTAVSPAVCAANLVFYDPNVTPPASMPVSNRGAGIRAVFDPDQQSDVAVLINMVNPNDDSGSLDIYPKPGAQNPANRIGRYFEISRAIYRVNPVNFADPTRRSEPGNSIYRGQLLVYFSSVENRGAPLAPYATNLDVTLSATNDVERCVGELTPIQICQNLGGEWNDNTDPNCSFRVPNLACGPNQYIRDIGADGNPICVTFTAPTCPAGTYLFGINAQGQPLCSPFSTPTPTPTSTPTPTPTPFPIITAKAWGYMQGGGCNGCRCFVVYPDCTAIQVSQKASFNECRRNVEGHFGPGNRFWEAVGPTVNAGSAVLTAESGCTGLPSFGNGAAWSIEVIKK